VKIPFLKSVLTAGLLAFSLAAPAEDIDLFVIPPRDDIDKPNVLIIVDNTANWNTAFEAEMDALQDTIENLPNDAFRIGIMFSAETGNPNNNVAGGYVRAAIRLMTAANKEKYKSLVDSFDRTGDAGNGGQSSLVMAEAYRYLSGGAPYAGNNKAKADYTGNVYGTSKSKAIYALGDNALSSIGATAYNKPSSTCQKNFIIYISNGAPNDNVSVRSESNSMLEAAATALGITGASTVIPLSPNASQANPSDEWARFMKQTALGVTTFTIDVDKVTTGQGPGWTAVLKSMASTSSGKYFDVSTAEGETGDALQEALNNILSEIQSVNSVFSSVSLPVSVNTQGTYLNQVFIGMFRPGVLPRWAGNLKQYKLGYDSSGTLTTLDADGNNAISSGGTGFIAECARSFWTPTTVDTYWAFDEQGACLAVADSKASNTPDGNYVEKGGQAYTLRGSPPSFTNALSRTVYTVFARFVHRADQLQHRERGHYPGLARPNRGGDEPGQPDQLGARGQRRQRGLRKLSDPALHSRRRGAFASGRDRFRRQHRGGGVLWRQRRHAARGQWQPHQQHRQRRGGGRIVVVHAAGVLSQHQAYPR